MHTNQGIRHAYMYTVFEIIEKVTFNSASKADVAKDIFCYACGLPEIDLNLDEPGTVFENHRKSLIPY